VVWTEYVRATLLDYHGWAAFAGVPKGHNWASNLWRSAAGREDWLQIHATTYENPYLDPAEIDKIKDEESEAIFNQEYLAMILSGEGLVFRRVMDAATAESQDGGHLSHEYVFGIDWAYSGDFTAVAVVDMTARALVYIDRYNGVDYTLQRDRIMALAERFRPVAIISEVNAMGRPNNEELRLAGLPVQDFTTTGATKEVVIGALAAAFERGDVRIIPDPALIAELQSYEGERLPGGGTRYGAPAGMHDDTVIALALAWRGATEGIGGVEVSNVQRNLIPSRRQRPR
jgi:hypothetical protein